MSSEISYTWIKNLSKLDKKNKLKHGEIYAKDGSVYNLEINDNHVKAKVKGAPGDVYDVEIKFTKFTNADKEKLMKIIKSNPVIYSSLLNKEISYKLFETPVKIFPDSIKDFKMSCSCNRGLFCKHKAAVLHKLENEISKNPFLLFSIKGFDLNDLIQEGSYKIKNIDDIFEDIPKFNLFDSDDKNYLEMLNFTLSDYPSFYPSKSVNFNEVIYDTLVSMSKVSDKIQNPKIKNQFHEYFFLANTLQSFDYFESKSKDEIKEVFEDKWGNPILWNEFKLEVGGNYEFSQITTGGLDNLFVSDLSRLVFGFFAEISQTDLYEYCEDIKFLHEIYHYTMDLIYDNAMIPELFRLENEDYCIRWIPVFEKEIYNQLDDFFKKCPDDLLTFKGFKISKQTQVINLISLFFKGFSRYCIDKAIPKKLSSFKNETYFRLFFYKSQDFSTYIYKGKEIEIENWISSLYLKQQNYKIIIDTVQSDGEFILQLNIELDGKIYSVSDIINLKRTDIIKNLAIVQNIFLRFGVDYDFSKENGMDIKDFSFFFNKIAFILRQTGVEVNAPKEFDNFDEVKLIINSNLKNPSSSLTLEDLTDFDWKIAIGDELFSVDDFESFSHDFRGLVKIKNKYYSLGEENLKRIREEIFKIPKDTNTTTMINYLLSVDRDNVMFDGIIEHFVDNLLKVSKADIPHNLNGTLRDYQERGFSWLIQNLKSGFGSILADDMGLGKTIQILSLLLYLKDKNYLNNEKILIVAPTSILTNWRMEFEKFAPSLNVEIYHGNNRKFPKKDYDILLTSYGILRSDIRKFGQQQWFLIVIDEAQNIKNPKSKQTKAVKLIKAKHHIALSGTPIENHLGEYWSIFDFTNKGYLKSLEDFKKRFIKPIENFHDQKVLKEFKQVTSPFILRRLKTDKSIIKDLPEKMVNDIYCNLTVKQASIYDETVNVQLDEVEKSEGIQRKGLVLKLINSLKQICNHPSQFLKIDEAEINESGKVEVLINILETIIESDEKVLIFTQYVQMGKILQKLIEETFDEEVLFLHGSVSREKRDEMIEKFQNGEPKIFILSLKAGGIGINLTAASNVIHYDLWWNPAVENQATDRAYRIGQTKNVMVYRFITKGTLEENINQILINKRELVDMTLGSEESFITEMSNEELRQMLNLRNSDY